MGDDSSRWYSSGRAAATATLITTTTTATGVRRNMGQRRPRQRQRQRQRIQNVGFAPFFFLLVSLSSFFSRTTSAVVLPGDAQSSIATRTTTTRLLQTSNNNDNNNNEATTITTTTPVIEETRDNYVLYPDNVKPLLENEITSIHTPLVIELSTSIIPYTWNDNNYIWHMLKGIVHRLRRQNQIIYVQVHLYIHDGRIQNTVDDYGCRITINNNNNSDTDPYSSNGESIEIPIQQLSNEQQGQYNISNSKIVQCQRQCTNGGRYCAPEIILNKRNQNSHNNNNNNDEQDSEEVSSYYVGWNIDLEPKVIIEETLRRLCIDDIYHTSDLKHWEYMENFEILQCQTKESSDQVELCAKEALHRVSDTDWSYIVQCMELSGGLENDVMNVKLQEQLDRQQDSYDISNLPLLHIQGTEYTGLWDVPSIFNSICDAYPHDKMEPLACQFCKDCHYVEHCLWFLECDGVPFDIKYVSNITNGDSKNEVTQGSLPPSLIGDTITITPPPLEFIETPQPPPPQQQQQADNVMPSIDSNASTPPSSPQQEQQVKPIDVAKQYYDDDDDGTTSEDNDDQDDDEMSVNTNGYFLEGILAGLILGMAPAIYFVRDEKHTRHKILVAQVARANAEVEGSWTGDNRRQSGGGGEDDDVLALSAGSNRPTVEEMQNMEDVELDLAGGGIGTIRNNNTNNTEVSPKFAFALALQSYGDTRNEDGFFIPISASLT